MAEPNRTPDASDPVARDDARPSAEPATAVPATDRSVADGSDARGHEVRRGEAAGSAAAAGTRDDASDASDASDRDETERDETVRDQPERGETGRVATGTGSDPVPAPPADQPVLAPAEESAPPAPHKGSNRLAGTAWVLLAAGLFEVLYFAVLALLTLLLASPAAVGPQLAVYAKTPLTWFPVLVFFLFFELTVLLFNRRGRFWYVVASLIVGVVVYLLTALYIDLSSGGSLADRNTVAQIFLTPPIVLVGLVAREVMLWTGFAIGARGKRVRLRNRAARDAYRQELAERGDRSA